MKSSDAIQVLDGITLVASNESQLIVFNASRSVRRTSLGVAIISSLELSVYLWWRAGLRWRWSGGLGWGEAVVGAVSVLPSS
ncbi:hypothetical protein TrST_g4002 [Triparma strigata]|uniref:Uncharacterized protein n=1 Tax=Triparma strigata TaxID=1606541 RepID=A0A9W7AN44_9STRA|nr:hypothetical protein TrST_g4002 [Triparma strigata]